MPSGRRAPNECPFIMMILVALAILVLFKEHVPLKCKLTNQIGYFSVSSTTLFLYNSTGSSTVKINYERMVAFSEKLKNFEFCSISWGCVSGRNVQNISHFLFLKATCKIGRYQKYNNIFIKHLTNYRVPSFRDITSVNSHHPILEISILRLIKVTLFAQGDITSK